jgi:cholesterol oxidase
LGEVFDAIVIGSGFGGSVMTYRLARGGKTVCLLERGKAYPPGSFARTPYEISRNFWRPSSGTYGLFDVWSFRHMAAVVSAGLGGGSLIYANVLLRKDRTWFAASGAGGERWPIGRAELDAHYDAVEAILRPEIYPEEFARGNKTAAMRAAASKLGYDVTTHDRHDPSRASWFLPPLAVRFRDRAGNARIGEPLDDREPNYHGKPRETCRLCGECDVGCNYGAKNTLDHTYLSLAAAAGADIRPLVEVEAIAPHAGGGYVVTFTRRAEGTGGAMASERGTLRAGRVIVAAGALGSTLLLMRSRKHLPRLSARLGAGFSGNGDFLAGAESCAMPLDASRAPVITSTFRFPDASDGAAPGTRGGYLQDAGYPLVADYVMETFDPVALLRRALRFAWGRLRARFARDPQTEIGGALGALVGRATLSRDSMPLLGMGRDVPSGTLRLGAGRRLALTWSVEASRAYYDRIGREARRVTNAMGGRYVQNPLTRAFNSYITVHPLGGCRMGANDGEGVVDAWGEVFNYPHLYVADGSVMPGSVGPNPSLTIAAFSDRVASRMLETWGSCAR